MAAPIATFSKARVGASARLCSPRPQVGANAWAKQLKDFMKTFAQPAKQTEMTGLVFQPFSEVQPELSTVGSTPATSSFARVEFAEECEAAVNEQINIEYTISYVYHALHAYFDRDNVGLPGFASFFEEASKEEREHAQLLIKYQNKRGGRVLLKACITSIDFVVCIIYCCFLLLS
jgi:ferritin heavy chain